MDEQRLGELFRNAVGEVPPASFGPDEVVAASRRATAARRTALGGGTLLGVAVLAGGLAASGLVDVTRLLSGGVSSETSAAGQTAPEAEARAADSGAPHTLSVPNGDELPAPRSNPPADAQMSCGPVDAELAAEVTAVLTERGVGVAGPVGEVPQWCADGARSAAVPVSGATLYVLLVSQAGERTLREIAAPDGTRVSAVPLDGGRELVVILMPAVPGKSTALSEDVPDVAGELARRF